MPFRSLDPAKILTTAERLEVRVRERFPDRGLTRVAGEVTALARQTRQEMDHLVPPLWWLRALVAAVVAGGAALFLLVGSVIPLNEIGEESLRSVANFEAALNTVVLAVLGLVALVRLESRIKRQRVAARLHELRSIIHVIDMHQLTKDPGTLSPGFTPTETSPTRDLTAAEMSRYLDYCSELLAMTGKLAALYAQAVPDDGVAQAVTDIELLGASLARKIWQKISMIDAAPLAPKRKARAQSA